MTRAAVAAVLAVGLALAGPTVTARAPAAGNAAVVHFMVVGPSGTAIRATDVRANSAVVRASGRRCKVAAATPMAALHAGVRRAGIGYKARDYGRCSRKSEGSSGQLFVYKVDRFRNRGSDGWVYKVNDRAGTNGAADADGPFGSGRLGSGDRLVWLYCRLNRLRNTCQRTLKVVATRRVKRGRRLKVRVLGYNDRGQGQPIARARVSFGGRSKTTDRRGRVFFTARHRGLIRLQAHRKRMVPSFPVRVRVR